MKVNTHVVTKNGKTEFVLVSHYVTSPTHIDTLLSQGARADEIQQFKKNFTGTTIFERFVTMLDRFIWDPLNYLIRSKNQPPVALVKRMFGIHFLP